MSKTRETSTDPGGQGIVDPFDVDVPKKPNWVNLAQLDTAVDDALVNNLLYKPALRYHGITSGLWGLGLSRTPSVVSDSRPPSYKFSESIHSKHNTDACSTCDQGSLYRTKNLSAVSPVTLRRRNTIAVILVAVALLAAVATITGIILHLMHPRALLRGHVRFTIANENFTDSMQNKSSDEFKSIARTICSEMDMYYLTSELSDFYLGCRLISLRNDTEKSGLAVHYTIDFTDNPTTNDEGRIRDVILRKSGRQASDANLYFVIRDYLVYLRSLRVELEKVPIPTGTPDYNRPIIPWRDDIDFISRKSVDVVQQSYSNNKQLTESYNSNDINITSTYVSTWIDNKTALKRVLPNAPDTLLPLLNREALHVNTFDNRTNQLVNVSLLTNNHFFGRVIDADGVQTLPSIGGVLTVGHVRDYTQLVQPTPASWFASTNRVTDGNEPFLGPWSQLQGNVLHGNDMKLQNFEELDKTHTMESKSRHFEGKKSILSRLNEHNVIEHHTGMKEVLHNNHGHHKNDKHHHHHHGTNDAYHANQVQSSIQASFNLANQHDEHFFQMSQTVTSIYQTTDINNPTIVQQSKIVTISKDVFIIMGQSSRDYKDNPLIRPTTPLFTIPVNTVLLPHNEVETSNDKHNNTDSVPTNGITQNYPDTTGNITILTVTTERPGNPIQNLISSEIMVTLNSTTKKVDETSLNVRMNELVVPSATRTNINPEDANIKWMNIFNVPRKTVNVHVGEVLKDRSNSATRPPDMNRFFNNFNISESVNFAIRDLLPDYKAILRRWSNLKQNDDVNRKQIQGPIVFQNTRVVGVTPEQEHKEMLSGSHSHHHANNHNNQHLHDMDAQESKNNEIVNDDFNDPNNQHPNFRVHRIEQLSNSLRGVFNKDRDEQHTGNMPQEPRVTIAREGEEQEALNVNIFQDDDRSESRQFSGGRSQTPHSSAQGQMTLGRRGFKSGLPLQRNQWQRTENGDHSDNQSQDVFMVQPRVGNDRVEIDGDPINIFQEYTQPSSSRRIFIHRNGLRWQFPVTASITEIENNANINERARHIHRDTYIETPSDNTGTALEENHSDDIENFIPVPWESFIPQQRTHFHERNPLMFTRTRRRSASNAYRQSWLRGNIFGIPISTEFDNIEDIKDILKEIIHSLFNMTEKIDHMQGAIDFINNTLHEEKRPIFRLEDTLQNMSASLDNLKLNLNTINATLNGFKQFLKQFDNTIFDVDDVIRHLDETFNNLNKTATFVGRSLNELDGTVDFVDDAYIKENKSLIHLNNSAYDVQKTTNFANKTLESMGNTLESLENAVEGLNTKVDEVLGGIDGINISLKQINNTVQNSYRRMKQINKKMNTMNSSVDSIEQTIARLNKTYRDIDEALGRMNETFVFINGTTLDVIRQLRHTDGRLLNISSNMNKMKDGMFSMNSSLQDTIDWMSDMVKTLNKFNSSLQRENNTIIINLQNTDLIETISTLLEMNNTLFEFGNNVDNINKKLDSMETALFGLEANLEQLKVTLDNINVTFQHLNSTLEATNKTIKLITKSLGHMNQSMDAINKTSNNLHSIFGSIDRTLDAVNSSLVKVNETAHSAINNAHSVNKTFNSTAKRIANIVDLTKNVSDLMTNSSGSLQDFSKNVYNANESLRVIQGKTEIVSESYDMLLDTLSGIESTIDYLFNRLNDTDESLRRVNRSFVDVNNSIENMEQTKQDWDDRLTKLSSTFNKMNESIQDISSAFPNLVKNMKNLYQSIVQLQTQITDQSDQLIKQNIRKDKGYERFQQLEFQANTLGQVLNETKIFLRGIRNYSAQVGKGFEDLKARVKDANNLFTNSDENLKLFNEMLTPLQARFDDLKNASENKQASLHYLAEELTMNMEKLRVIENSSSTYENLIVPFRQIEDETNMDVDTVIQIQSAIDTSLNQLTNQTGLVWNEGRHPISNSLPNQVLRGRMKTLNSTMDNVDNILSKAEVKTKDINERNNKVKYTFGNLTKVKGKIDEMSVTADTTNHTILALGKLINSKQNETDYLNNKVSLLKEMLEEIKLHYGNINGTHNTTIDDYTEMESKIQTSLDKIRAIESSLNNTKTIYTNLIKSYDEIMGNYSNKKFGIDGESQKRIDGFISDLQDNQHDLRTLMQLDNITKASADANISITEIDSLFRSLQTELLDKKDSHNFLKKRQPLLLDRLNSMDTKFQGLNTTIQALLKQIEELRSATDNTRNKATLLPNIDVELYPEYDILNGSKEALVLLNGKMSRMLGDIAEANSRFESLMESELPFTEVRNEYKSLQSTIGDMNNTMETLSQTGKRVDEDLRSVALELDSVNKLLEKYNASHTRAKLLYDDVGEMNMKTLETGKLLSSAKEVFERLESTLISIQTNYTNFTATNVNLSDSFILETISEMKGVLQNLTIDFNDSQNISEVLNRDSTLLVADLEERNFTRANTNNILDNVVIKRMNAIEENVHILNNSLNEISSKIEVLDITLQGVNETLHTTNEQLFLNRQKKLLADSKFPDLEKERLRLDNKLDEISTFLVGVNQNISDIMQDNLRLEDRLSKYPNFNISTEDLQKILGKFEHVISNATSKINETKRGLQRIRKTLWIEDRQRYTENETIADMKNRYKEVSHAMKDINDMIENLSDQIYKSNKEAGQIHKEILDVDKNLDEFDSLDSKLSDMRVTFNGVNNAARDARNGLEDVGNRLTDVFDRFTELGTNFEHINHTAFKTLTEALQHKLSTGNNSFRILSDNTNEMETLIRQLDDVLKDIDDKQSVIIKNKKGLTDTNKFINERLGNASKLVTSIEILINSIGNDTEVLKDRVVGLNEDMIDVRENMLRQEKKEFYETNHPLRLFENVSITLVVAEDVLNLTSYKFDETNEYLLNIQDKISKFSNIDLPLYKTENQLVNVNETIIAVGNTLENMISDQESLKQLLNAPDGLPYSDNETIDEMRNRYKAVNLGLENIFKNVSNATQLLDGARLRSLPRQDELLTNVNELLDDFNNTSTELENLQTIASDLEKIIKKEVSLNDQRDTQMNKYNVTLENLNVKYRQISSPDIQTFNESLITNLQAKNRSLRNLSRTTDEVFKNLKNINGTINEQITFSNRNFTSFDDIRFFIGNFSEVADSMSEKFDSVNDTISSSHAEGEVFDESMVGIRQMINTYEVMLKDEEKHIYVEEMVDKLQNLSLNLYRDFHNVSEYTAVGGKQMRTTLLDILRLQDYMKNIEQINISMQEAQDETNNDLLSLKLNNDSLGEIENILKHVFDSFKQMNTTNYIRNETIDDLRRSFSTLTGTLDNVRVNLSALVSDLSNLMNSNRRTHSFLKDVENETRYFDNLRTDASTLNQELAKIESISRNVHAYQLGIKNFSEAIDSKMAFINNSFTKVDRDDLWNTLNGLSKQHKANKSIVDRLGHQQEKTNGLFRDITSNLTRIDSVINQPVYDIDQLKSNNNFTRSRLADAEKAKSVVNSSLELQKAEQVRVNEYFIEIDNRLNDLMKEFKHQEMMDYIKSNFPRVVDQFAYVNESLLQTDGKLTNIRDTIENLSLKLSDTGSVIANHTIIEFPLLDNRKTYDTIITRFQNAVGSKENITTLFQRLLAVFSHRISTNDTIGTVEDRFEDYNGTLNDIMRNITDLHSKIDRIYNDSSGQLNTLNKIGNEILRFNDVRNETKRVRKIFDQTESILYDKGKQIIDQKKQVEKLIREIIDLQDRFNEVKDEGLQSNAEDIALTTQNLSLKIDKTISDFEGFKRGFDDDNTLLGNIENVIQKPRVDLDNAIKMLDNAQGNLTILGAGLNEREKGTMPYLEEVITNYTHILNDTENKIESLRGEFLKGEKQRYLNSMLPDLLAKYKQLHESFTDIEKGISSTSRNIMQANETLSELSSNISKTTNIEFNTSLIQLDIEEADHDTITNTDILKEQQDLFNAIDNGVFIDTFWNDHAINVVKDKLTNIQARLASIGGNVTELNTTNNLIIKDIEVVESDMSQMSNVINKYGKISDISTQQGMKLTAVAASVNNTGRSLLGITESYNALEGFWDNLTNTYRNISNEKIDRLMASVEKLLIDKVGFRLPLLETLFKTKLEKKRRTAESIHKANTNKLNDTHLSATDLRKLLFETEKSIDDLDVQINDMNATNRNFYQEINQLSSYLNETEILLKKLESALKTEQEERYLKEVLPKFAAAHDKIGQSLANISKEFHDTRSALNETEQFLGNLTRSLQTYNNMNISNALIQDGLQDKQNIIQEMKHDLARLTNELESLSPKHLNTSDLIQRRDIAHLKRYFNRLHEELGVIENETDIIGEEMLAMDEDNKAYLSDLKNLQFSIKRYINATKNLNLTSNELDKVVRYKNDTSKLLNNARHKLAVMNNSLHAIYKEYGVPLNNDTTSLGLLKDTQKRLHNLTNLHTDATALLDKATEELWNTDSNMTAYINSTEQLNKTVISADKQLSEANNKLGVVRQLLDEINNNIPYLNASLESIRTDVEEINKTLKNEDDKLQYSNDVLPKLRAKYETINMTFDLTNKSLKIMQDNIAKLEKQIRYVKSNMNKFANINISMSDMESNVTHMEDRLTIMQDHYDNVQAIVTDLQKELEKNDISGQNISLNDTRMRYNNFNATLDKIDNVLRKIDMEITDMDDHLMYINDTLVSIDSALESFEEEGNKGKTMKMNMVGIEESLNKTSSDIAELSQTFVKLNESFVSMQLTYKDVLSTTASNNTQFSKDMEDLQTELDSIRQIADELRQGLTLSSGLFRKMNKTLFQNISTYNTLNATLLGVRETYNDLFSSLKSFEDRIKNTNRASGSLNSSLADLGDILSKLNDTLHREQEKYNFLNSNFGGLQSKTKDVASSLGKTDAFISSVKGTVENGNSTLEKLKSKLRTHKNLNITLETEDSVIGTSFKSLGEIENSRLENLKNTFQDLIRNMTSVQDRSGKISDIKKKYNSLNETLDMLKENIEGITKELGVTNNKTMSVESYSQELISSVQAFENVSSVASEKALSVKDIGNKLQQSEGTIDTSRYSVSMLEQESQEMLTKYNYVDDKILQNNLTSIIKELAANKEMLRQLKGRHNVIKGSHSTAVNSSDAVNRSLQSTIDSKSDLDLTVVKGTESLKYLDTLIANITKSNLDLATESLEVQNRINDLENQLRNLNETMHEEKMKIDYVNQNFPGAKARHDILNKDIQSSDGEINNVSGNFVELKNSLTDVSKAIDSITEIKIPLNKERQITDKIEKEISDLKKMYNNITSRYDGLNLLTLQDRNRTYKQLRVDYNTFDDDAYTISEDLKVLDDRLALLNNKLRKLNGTSMDINSTVVEFKDAKNNAKTLFKEIQKASDLLTSTNTSVVNMDIALKRLNHTIKDIIANFSDVKDPLLHANKQAIENLLNETLKRLSKLKENTDTLSALNKATGNTADKLNNTLTKTKTKLDDLKTDLMNAGRNFENITTLLNRINDEQARANITSNELDPDIKLIMDKVKQLYISFEKEQSKLDYIKDEKPILQKYFKDLSEPIQKTNRNISKTEKMLVDLKFNIKTVGDRLNRFRPIKITTKPEMNKWVELSDSVQAISKEFINMTRTYNELKQKMSHMDDRNKSIAEIKSHYKDINASIDKISNDLVEMNRRLGDIGKVSEKIETDIAKFDIVMDNFKSVQKNINSIKTEASKVSKNLSDMKTEAGGLKLDITSTKKNVIEMEKKFKVLSDKDWERKLPKFKADISKQEVNIKTADSKSRTLNQSLNDTTARMSQASSELQNTGLNRTNADQIIKQVNRTLSGVSRELQEVNKATANLNKTLTVIKNRNAKSRTGLRQMNKILSVELQKFRFVNKTLPVLQNKHSHVNATFKRNAPDVKNLQAQIDDVVAVISKIKEKMRVFGMQDTDKSVQNWDQAIVKLNKTVNTIIKRNKQAANKLLDLKQKLWKKGPLYTKQEGLKVVKDRFNGYNKSLEEIIAAVHKIKIKLRDLDNTSQELSMTLVDHETMLTTTPEPLGPPHWLQLSSTDVGIIGKDSGIVECSVGDLMDWDVLKITRQRGNDQEQTVAAWKLGLGSRKLIRDRRISVKKSENSTGGSLQVNIRSLQCEDEATYYCSIDTYRRYPLQTDIAVITPPEDSLDPEFPTEVFEDKVANFSCTGHPGYPNGRLIWKIKRQNEKNFKDFNFYSEKTKVTDTDCIRTETNTVEYQFDMSWNNTKVRCYIENTQFYGEGIIRLLPFDICNKVRFLGTIKHPYTPHKYIVCGKELNIMQCPGNTCYDKKSENCVQCKAGQQSADPCHGKPLYSYVAHEKDCKKYYICIGPTKTVKKCARGYFNPNVPGYCVISYAQSYCAQRAG